MAHIIGHGRYARETYPEARPPGGDGACLTPLDRVLYVDAGTATPPADQNGSISCPFATIQDAIDSVPAPVDLPDETVPIVIRIAAGQYDEDVAVPGTRTWSLTGWDGTIGLAPISVVLGTLVNARTLIWLFNAPPTFGTTALALSNLLITGDLNIEANVGSTSFLQLDRCGVAGIVQSTGIAIYSGVALATDCFLIEVAVNFGAPGVPSPAGFDRCLIGSITTPTSAFFSAAQSTIALLDMPNLGSSATVLTECILLSVVDPIEPTLDFEFILIDSVVSGGSLNNRRGVYDTTSFRTLHSLGILTGAYTADGGDTNGLMFERTVLEIGDTSFSFSSMRSINTVIADPSEARTVTLPSASASAYFAPEGVGTRGFWVKNRGPSTLSVAPDGADTINGVAAAVDVPASSGVYFVVTDAANTNWETLP